MMYGSHPLFQLCDKFLSVLDRLYLTDPDTFDTQNLVELLCQIYNIEAE